MALLVIFQPASSTVLHIKYLLKRARYTGQAVESYKMKKMPQLIEALMMMNNFSSLLFIIFTLHLANAGRITLQEPALVSISTATTVLHLMKMLINIIQSQTSGDQK
jgi:hypothetical protein